MKDSIRRKLEKLDERFEEISRLLSDAGVISRQNQFRELSMEYSRLEDLVGRYRRFIALEGDAATARELASDPDPATRAMGAEELADLNPRILAEELELQRLLVPKDPHDDSNIFLEVRAGTGGDEAAIFAGDLFRMYARYAEGKGWGVEILSESPGEHGGYKEIISRIIGRGAYSLLEFESGTHRVQRVPATEAQGRIQTSACTVAILPELEEVEAVELNPRSCASTPIAPRAPAVSTSTRPTRPFASRICRPALSSSARTSARSTRTVRGPCPCSRPSCCRRNARNNKMRGAVAQTPGRFRRSLGAHPDLQLSAGPRDGSPHQSHLVQARRCDERQSRRTGRARSTKSIRPKNWRSR